MGFKGHVRVRAYCRRTGQQLWTCETDNLVVLTSTIDVVRLVANSAGFPISAVGFGSGTGTPAIGDTALSDPSYYRAVDGISVSVSPLPAGLTVDWSINGGSPLDYGAEGINVQEIGLFTNSAGVQIPAAANNSNLAAWQALHAYALGDTIVDGASNVQVVTTAGTSGGSAPAFATTIGLTTADGGVTWTMRAAGVAPTRLFTRALMPMGVQSTLVSFSSDWTLTAA